MAPARKNPPKHSTRSSSKTGLSRRGHPAFFTDSSPFRLANHRLEGNKVNYVETPNKGGIIYPSYLVFHYTAGRSSQSSIAWLTNPLAKASAHLVVGRDGTITQLAPFTTKTWHAGVSHWDGLTGLNQHSIGIEMDNAGPLIPVGTKLTAWFGKSYPTSQAIFATHKLDAEPKWWHAFSEKQILISVELAKILVQQYGLKDILGHDDIAPDRKRDPGPAFPLGHIRALVMGRSQEEEDWYQVLASALNIRSGPGSEYDTVASPLTKGTKLLALEKQDRWTKVEVEPGALSSGQDLTGWVFNRYIKSLNG
ncbi:N-acetylmuramoyl-L-alanine amidase [uncultured Nitrospira sp.]|uniref:N-acetylmuramoyl-L-alanine amidase n=1 Tax=uncultured Nitrospira sp. TaxID=157176 RepID=UPI003140AC4A